MNLLFLECMQEHNEDNFFKSEQLVHTSEKPKRLEVLKSFLLPVGVGFVITALVVLIFSRGSSRSFAHHLCNGLFISFVVIAGFGGLTVINKEGFFDIAFFGVKQFFQMVKSTFSKNAKVKIDIDFLAYKKKKYAKRLARWSWVIVGAFFFILAFVTLFFCLKTL